MVIGGSGSRRCVLLGDVASSRDTDNITQTILVHLRDGEVWQSGNEGYSWAIPKAVEKEKVLAVYHHQYSHDRAYLITQKKIYVTTDTGRSYTGLDLPSPPNMMGLALIHTHPLESDWLIYVGAEDCSTAAASNCRAVAYYSVNHGRSWTTIEKYVRSCSWARDKDLKIDARLIMCESYRDKKGSQLFFGGNNPLELWIGGKFYQDRKKLFDNVVGHAKFSKYLLVGEVNFQFGPHRSVHSSIAVHSGEQKLSRPASVA